MLDVVVCWMVWCVAWCGVLDGVTRLFCAWSGNDGVVAENV